MININIIGGGKWGMALAIHLSNCRLAVTLLSKRDEIVYSINNHSLYQEWPKIALSPLIKAVNMFEELHINSNTVNIITLPAQEVTEFINRHQAMLFSGNLLIIGSKGIDNKTNKIITELMPNADYALISGPNFAQEIAQGLPAITSLSGYNKEKINFYCQEFSTPSLKFSANYDPIGTAICSSAKNVLAIACGLAKSLKQGDNFTAKIFSIGISELSALIIAHGGEQETLLTSAGIGDLYLTCSSMQSRNFQLGYNLLHDDFKNNHLSEGYHSIKSLINIAKNKNLSLKLFAKLHDIIFNNSKATELLKI